LLAFFPFKSAGTEGVALAIMAEAWLFIFGETWFG